MNEAMRHFQTAFELNPTSREAEREIRLHEVRMKKKQESADDSRGFFKRLFKKWGAHFTLNQERFLIGAPNPSKIGPTR